MLVETILKAKGTLVHTLPETATLAEAVALLNQHNIGAVVVTSPEGAVTGILSERDVVRRLGTDPAATLSLRIAECMSRAVVTAGRTASIAEIMETMTRRRIRHVPVVDGGELVGIVSIGDVVKLKIEEVEHEAEELRSYIAS